MPKFTLHIQVGNSGMTTLEDVARALRTVADRVENESHRQSWGLWNIRDNNGNTVGEWSIEQDGLPSLDLTAECVCCSGVGHESNCAAVRS